MTTTEYKGKPITKELVKQALEDETIFGDGHMILSPEAYHPHFDVSHIEETFKSDFSDHKSTLFVDGQPVEELKGVYNLTFLYWLANEIKVDHSGGDYMGRGFQARAIVRAIWDWANGEDS